MHSGGLSLLSMCSTLESELVPSCSTFCPAIPLHHPPSQVISPMRARASENEERSVSSTAEQQPAPTSADETLARQIQLASTKFDEKSANSVYLKQDMYARRLRQGEGVMDYINDLQRMWRELMFTRQSPMSTRSVCLAYAEATTKANEYKMPSTSYSSLNEILKSRKIVETGLMSKESNAKSMPRRKQTAKRW
eukprot:jgi/Phyca11/15330/fgenesh1_pg.PHYCAscaffold_13_\